MTERKSADVGEADGSGAAALILDLDGFEGPIDLLLSLAREQKVDLTKMSILALAESVGAIGVLTSFDRRRGRWPIVVDCGQRPVVLQQLNTDN